MKSPSDYEFFKQRVDFSRNNFFHADGRHVPGLRLFRFTRSNAAYPVLRWEFVSSYAVTFSPQDAIPRSPGVDNVFTRCFLSTLTLLTYTKHGSSLLFHRRLLSLLRGFPVRVSLAIRRDTIRVDRGRLSRPVSSVPFIFLLPLSRVSLLLRY